MHNFVFAIHRLRAMLFRLDHNFLNDFLVVVIEILNALASFCFIYSISLVSCRQYRPNCVMPNLQPQFARAWIHWVPLRRPDHCAPHQWPPAFILVSKRCCWKLCTCCEEQDTWKKCQVHFSNAHQPALKVFVIYLSAFRIFVRRTFIWNFVQSSSDTPLARGHLCYP